MFTLLVCAGDCIYGIDAMHVAEVIPQVAITKIPHVPDYLLGHIFFDGKPVPVADLSLIIEGKPSGKSMHTRIVLVRSKEQGSSLFGVLAEKVTEAIEIEEGAFAEPGVHPLGLPFFGGFFSDGGMQIQMLDMDKLYAFLQIAPGH